MLFSTPRLAQVAEILALLVLPSSISALSIGRRATTCNGSPDLCDRSFGNVTFVGAHDSYAVGNNNLAANQDYNVTQQLIDGIRMLQVQVHVNGDIHLCHTSCLLYDGGPLETYLTTVKSWMDSNPNDVVSMLMVNSESLLPTNYSSVFEAAGVTELTYSPPQANMTPSEWPTLGSLIDAGTRLVVFMDYGADFTQVPYIIDEFANVWETAFDVTDPTFDCNVNRTDGDPSNTMYLINHFLDESAIIGTSPDKDQLNVTNAVNGTGSLGLQASQCAGEYGRNPNFMLVDFYEYGGGSVFEVAASLNGVSYNPTLPIATPIPDSDTSTTNSNAAISRVAIPSISFFTFLFGGLILESLSTF